VEFRSFSWRRKLTFPFYDHFPFEYVIGGTAVGDHRHAAMSGELLDDYPTFSKSLDQEVADPINWPSKRQSRASLGMRKRDTFPQAERTV
jgi:hypothetical protein